MRPRYRLDDLLIDVACQRVERDGKVLEVAGLSFRLLHYLLQQAQRVVGFDELMAQVWAPAVVNEETLTQRVRLLRQALCEDGRNPRYLRSVRGQGYQLCAAPELLPPVPAAASRRARPVRAIGWAVAVLAVVLASGLSWQVWLRPPVATAMPSSPLLQRAAYYAGIGQQDDNERAIGLYQQRLRQAPDDNLALVGLSRAYSARVCLFNADPAWAVRAEALARQVIAAQPDAAGGHAALAYSQDCRGQVAAALAGYEQALQRNPADDATRASAAYLYQRKGQLAQALAANLAVRDPARVRFSNCRLPVA
jgi:DNA-binding winged helix-turn-helix (wHTH) protein